MRLVMPSMSPLSANVDRELDFQNHPAVINGYSELMAQVFGDENGIAA